MTATLPFGFSSTAAEVLSGVDLAGKTMIVTGGARGIGIETVRSLASAGAAVTIAARKPEAAEDVARSIREQTGNPQIDVRPLDLADLRSVRNFVADWEKPLHALVNNAASWRSPNSSGPPRAAKCSSRPISSDTSPLQPACALISLKPKVPA